MNTQKLKTMLRATDNLNIFCNHEINYCDTLKSMYEMQSIQKTLKSV